MFLLNSLGLGGYLHRFKMLQTFSVGDRFELKACQFSSCCWNVCRTVWNCCWNDRDLEKDIDYIMLLLHALQPVPAEIGWEVGYTPHRSPVCCRANTHRHTDNNSRSCAPTANLESPVYLTSLSLDSGIKPTHTQGGRENLWANKDLFLSPWRDFHHRTVPDFQGLEIKPIAPGFLSVLSLYVNKIDHFFILCLRCFLYAVNTKSLNSYWCCTWVQALQAFSQLHHMCLYTFAATNGKDVKLDFL